MKNRLIEERDLPDVPPDSWEHVQQLPGGMVLLDPTPTEQEIIELYAARLRKQQADTVCQQ